MTRKDIKTKCFKPRGINIYDNNVHYFYKSLFVTKKNKLNKKLKIECLKHFTNSYDNWVLCLFLLCLKLLLSLASLNAVFNFITSIRSIPFTNYTKAIIITKFITNLPQ